MNKRYFEDIKESVDTNMKNIRSSVLTTILGQEKLTKENLFASEFLTEVKKKMLRFVSGEKPLMCTHDIANEEQDAVLNHFKKFGLTNNEEDKVKVVFKKKI